MTVVLFAQFVPEDKTPVYPVSSSRKASYVNPAFTPENGHAHPGEVSDMQLERGAEEMLPEPFGEYDDSGIYGYGIFARNRCSRCRMSRIVHCTRL